VMVGSNASAPSIAALRIRGRVNPVLATTFVETI
jgi:hypothetical protein